MDVVRRNIDALRGQIEIQTEQNVGTTFSIRLPLTLAIIDGMVLRVGAERFIVPTLSIVRSIRPNPENLSTMLNANEMMMVQGQLIPIFRLNHLFSIEDAVEELTEGIAIIVEDDGRQAAILVDELLGQQQIVIKPLGEVLQGTQGLSGAAVMPDGRVGLILDVNGLLKIAGDMITQQ